VGIVTDIPDIFKGPGFRLASMSIRHCTDYVLLTQAMNDRLNPKGRPYVILEGHADISMGSQVNTLEGKTKPRICFYAGGVSKQYGLGNLVEGFRMANTDNAVLHIYGPGDYVEELQEIAEKDSRIFYGGMLLNHEIVEKELEATLLVNPRPTQEEYVKYSFPSKTMEYMASGTAVLTTVLPGMPKEYHPYVFLLEDESAEGIAKKLEQVLSSSEEDLFQKGMAARTFVLEQKNNVIQAGKLLDMVRK
jgi:glycosyltransferase involved in cell wall biosynthesis